MVRILITGGTGVLAQNLAINLISEQYQVFLTTRQSASELPAPAFKIGDINGHTDWREALKNIDVVIHIAAYTPQLALESGIKKSMLLRKFLSVNKDGTECLARAAIKSGVKRFIYLSSILTVGNQTAGESVFSNDGQPLENDEYAVSKRKGEDSLLSVARGTPLEVVILRTPPIYGPGVKNNILVMFKAILGGWPLPVKTIKNHLSFIYIKNLVSAISTVVGHTNSLNKTYFVCDQEVVSTPQFFIKIAGAMGKSAHLFYFPVFLLRLMGLLTGQKFVVGRLVNSLKVDGSRFCEDLDWKPPILMNDGLKASVEWYLTQNKK